MLYSVYDLVGHNRRQKQLFISAELEKLKIASQAVAAGTATSEQIDIVKRETLTREEEEKKRRAEEKAARGSVWKRGREWLFGGMETGKEELDESVFGDARVAVGGVEGEGVGILEKVEEMVERERRGDADTVGGGTLDKMAGNLADRVNDERKGWWEWVWRKGRRGEEEK